MKECAVAESITKVGSMHRVLAFDLQDRLADCLSSEVQTPAQDRDRFVPLHLYHAVDAIRARASRIVELCRVLEVVVLRPIRRAPRFGLSTQLSVASLCLLLSIPRANGQTGRLRNMPFITRNATATFVPNTARPQSAGTITCKFSP